MNRAYSDGLVSGPEQTSDQSINQSINQSAAWEKQLDELSSSSMAARSAKTD